MENRSDESTQPAVFSQSKFNADIRHDECRWNYKISNLAVVGSNPTGPVATNVAKPGECRADLGP
jgi:hypothetical protein